MLSDQTRTDERDQDRTHEFLARGVRYVRVTVTGLKDGAWASIFEVQVYGTNKVSAPAGDDDLGPAAAAQAGRKRRPARRDQDARRVSR